MESKKVFEKYYSRLAREGILKAIICGIIIGFAVDFVFAFVTWFFANNLWFILSLVFGLVVGVVTSIVLYYKAFRPTTKSIARRIDSLGLEERLITMAELENDESYIAMRQREDAKLKLNEFSVKSIKFVIAKSLIIVAVIVAVFGLSMTTVNALTGYGVFEKPKDILYPEDPDADYVFVFYLATEGGTIEGATDQYIGRGDSADTVIAVPDAGYIFFGWDDGLSSPERTDIGVMEDLTVVAIFGTYESGENPGDPGDPGDPNDDPSDPDDTEDQDPPPNDQDGQKQEQEGDGDRDRSPEGDTGGDGSGGQYTPNDMIHRNDTKYDTQFGGFSDDVMDEVSGDGNLSDEDRDMLNGYHDNLDQRK